MRRDETCTGKASRWKKKTSGGNVKFRLALLCPCISLLVNERAQDFCNGERWSGGDLKRWRESENTWF